MAEVISFEDEAQRDEHLADLGSWATTVLGAEIKAEGLEEHLLQEVEKFSREFVLFLPVKLSMELELADGTSRIIHRDQDGDTVTLHEKTVRWRPHSCLPSWDGWKFCLHSARTVMAFIVA